MTHAASPVPPDAGDEGVTRHPPLGTRAKLASMVDVAIAHQRTVGQHDAERLTQVFRVLEFAASNAADFVAARFEGAPARDLARRAAIAELAVALRTTEQRVDRLASDAAVLCRRLPAVLRGMRDGELDYERAKVIIDAVDPLEEQPEAVAALDEQLAELARTANPSRLRRAARQLVERAQADTLAARHERARAERRVELHFARDGMAWLHLLLPAADALLIRNRLCQAADRARSADEQVADAPEVPATPDVPAARVASDAPGTPDGSTAVRSDRPEVRARLRREIASEKRLDQLRADLARDLLLHGEPSDQRPEGTKQPETSTAGIHPTIHVTVPVMTLLGRTEEPGILDGYGPIDADTARELASTAPSFTRLLTHPVTSAVLDVDRTSYRVPADLRKWLQVRDGTCRFPGCSRPAIRCDLDHSADWAGEGGATSHDNLAHLCAAHHHLKHDTGWSLRHLEDGVLEWTSPAGARYRTEPETRVGTMPAPHRSDPDPESPPPF